MSFRSRNQDPLPRALLACVVEHDWAHAPVALDALAGIDPQLERFVPLATWHRCGAASWLGVRSTDLAATTGGRELEKRYREGIARHLRVVSDLAAIGSALRAAEVPFAVVKGPVLSTTLYARPDLRFYDDVDVLVQPADFGAAIEALERSGCVVLDANWAMLEQVVAGQIHLATPLGTVIDLHWNLVNEHAFRDAFPVDTENLLDRTVDVIINGTVVPTLDPVDTLTHLCLHAAMAGANRLGWLKDVDRAVNAVGGEWQPVVDRAREWRAGSAIGTVLARAARFLSTPVPGKNLGRAGRRTHVADRDGGGRRDRALSGHPARWLGRQDRGSRCALDQPSKHDRTGPALRCVGGQRWAIRDRARPVAVDRLSRPSVGDVCVR
jgi:hypothetical protein